jgi:8-oxo-dGTP diphosphatase
VTDNGRVLEFTDYDTRLAAYAVIVDDQDRILLALWNEVEPPQWTLPGGGVEFDETPDEGCVREVHEETGYDVALLRTLGANSSTTPAAERPRVTDRPAKSVRVFYEAAVVGGELRNEQGGTTSEARWIPVAEVRDLPHVATVDHVLGLIGR